MLIGLVLNPAAGLGGPLALKGSDGFAALARACGAVSQVDARAREALRTLAPVARNMRWFTGGGPLGADLLREFGFDPTILHDPGARETTAADTRMTAAAAMRAGVNLLIFAGGDGTARDVLAAIGEATPALGITAGVKMQSAVFGATPIAAGRLAADFLGGRRIQVHHREVMDVDEDLLREGRVAARLHGYLRCPTDLSRLQGAKSRTAPSEEAQVASLGVAVARRIALGGVHVLGPGSTLHAVKRALGVEGALLGVDVVKDGALLARDVAEAGLFRLVDGGDATLWVTCIGGQGHIFGRGNRQISPRILNRIGRDAIMVVATVAKITALGGALRVDTGDARADLWLSGYRRVTTGAHDAMVCRVLAESLESDKEACR